MDTFWNYSTYMYNVQIQYAYKENDLDAPFVSQSDKSCQGKKCHLPIIMDYCTTFLEYCMSSKDVQPYKHAL